MNIYIITSLHAYNFWSYSSTFHGMYCYTKFWEYIEKSRVIIIDVCTQIKLTENKY